MIDKYIYTGDSSYSRLAKSRLPERVHQFLIYLSNAFRQI